MKYNSIIILGAPGSGKGTQGKALGALPEFFHCACGNVFRSINSDTKLGQIFVDYSSKGQLVPDEVTIQLWLNYISECEKNRTFMPQEQSLVLDGIPRNLNQAKLLDSFIQVQMTFHLRCSSKEELVARIRRRALKEKRHDDALEHVIFQRLNVYEMESQPLLTHYSRVHHIDALQPALAIHEQILANYPDSSISRILPFSEESNKMSYESRTK